MKTTDLKRVLSSMESLMDEPCELNNDWEQSANVNRDIIAFIHIPKFLINKNKNLNN